MFPGRESHSRTRSRISACSPSSSRRRVATSDPGRAIVVMAASYPACNAAQLRCVDARGGIRTRTPRRTAVFETAASAIPPPGPADIVRAGRSGRGGGGPARARSRLAPRLLGGRLLVRRPATRLRVAVAVGPATLLGLVAAPSRTAAVGVLIAIPVARLLDLDVPRLP